MNSAQRLAARLVRNIRVANGCKSILRKLTTATNRKVLKCVQNSKLCSLPTGTRLKTTSSRKFAVINIQDGDDFEKRVIEDSFTKPVIVAFNAKLCGQCRWLAHRLEAILADLNSNVILANVNDNLELAREYDVSGFPTLIAIKNARVHSQSAGPISDDQIREFVNKLLYS